MSVDEGVLNATVAEETHDMQDILGFLIFHSGFEVPEGVEGNLLYTWIMEFPSDPLPLTREDTSLVAYTSWKNMI
jgi:hypothetical protein